MYILQNDHHSKIKIHHLKIEMKEKSKLVYNYQWFFPISDAEDFRSTKVNRSVQRLSVKNYMSNLCLMY